MAGDTERRVDRLSFGHGLRIPAHLPQRFVVEVFDCSQLLSLEDAQVFIQGGVVINSDSGVEVIGPIESGEDDGTEEREEPPIRQALVKLLDTVVTVRHQDRLFVVVIR